MKTSQAFQEFRHLDTASMGRWGALDGLSGYEAFFMNPTKTPNLNMPLSIFKTRTYLRDCLFAPRLCLIRLETHRKVTTNIVFRATQETCLSSAHGRRDLKMLLWGSEFLNPGSFHNHMPRPQAHLGQVMRSSSTVIDGRCNFYEPFGRRLVESH